MRVDVVSFGSTLRKEALALFVLIFLRMMVELPVGIYQSRLSLPISLLSPSLSTQNSMLGSLQGLPPNNQQQQGQQQQQSQQHQNQSNAIPPPPPQNGQDVTLSSVLHFLQSEWRRYERDRNEWEIERAEMRVSFRVLRWHSRAFPVSQYFIGTNCTARRRETIV